MARAHPALAEDLGPVPITRVRRLSSSALTLPSGHLHSTAHTFKVKLTINNRTTIPGYNSSDISIVF